MIKALFSLVNPAREPWSGIDAGRRQQPEPSATNLRHFRRTRRSVKRGTDQIPGTDRLQLVGSSNYLRALRAAEMKAWHATGGDWYRPQASSLANDSRPVARAPHR